MTDTEEIAHQSIIEPVELETVKAYIGYSPTVGDDDRFLLNSIRSARARLEDRMGCAIARRDFVTRSFDVSPGERVTIPLLRPLRAVRSVVFIDTGGDSEPCESYSVRPGNGASVFVDVPPNVTEVRVTYSSGYDVCPEPIKTAIMLLVKADNDRTTEDVIGPLRPMLQKYWNDNI